VRINGFISTNAIPAGLVFGGDKHDRRVE